MGSSGFSVILNLIQFISFIFTVWSTLIFTKEIFEIYKNSPIAIFVLTIILFIIYFFLYALIISIALRWFTIISSIETNRNEKCLNKTIKLQMKNYSEISQTISYSFKKIFYDNIAELEEENNPIKLSITNFQKKINFYLKRFKKLTDVDKIKLNSNLNPIEIDIKFELPQFLKSCGMELNEEEFDFMLHISGDKNSLIEKKLKHKQLDDIWAGVNYFCSRNNHEIIREVFINYHNRDGMEYLDLQAMNNFNYNKISDFVVFYKEYFDDKLIKFILEETNYLGRNFSLDAFIFRILGYGCLNSY